jgi:hypothetical protein
MRCASSSVSRPTAPGSDRRRKKQWRSRVSSPQGRKARPGSAHLNPGASRHRKRPITPTARRRRTGSPSRLASSARTRAARNCAQNLTDRYGPRRAGLAVGDNRVVEGAITYRRPQSTHWRASPVYVATVLRLPERAEGHRARLNPAGRIRRVMPGCGAAPPIRASCHRALRPDGSAVTHRHAALLRLL